jgi:DNA-directed RNA polymerase specialized sigma24 family protein
MDPIALNDHLSKIETCWNILKQAHGGSTQKREAARAWFVERYQPMVQRYLAKAVGPEAAADLTQEFAMRFLEGRYQHAGRSPGRFRDYLKTSLFALVADYRKEQAKQKSHHLPEEGWEPADHRVAAESDDQNWKMIWRGEFISRSLGALEREERRAHNFLYTVFKFRLDHPGLRSPQAAEKLSDQVGKSVSAGWFRKRLMASRERFAALLLDAVAESLDNPTLDEVKEELAALGLLDYCGPLLDRLRA